jgi:hypothetical protein
VPELVQELLQGPEIEQEPEFEKCPELQQKSELQGGLELERSLEQQGPGSTCSLEPELQQCADFEVKPEHQCGMEKLLVPEFQQGLGNKMKLEVQHDSEHKLEVQQGPELELHQGSELQQSLGLEQSPQQQGSGPDLEPELEKGADLELKPELQQGLENKLEAEFQQGPGHGPKPKVARLSTFQQERSSLKTTDLETLTTAVLHEACTPFSSQSQPQPSDIAAPAPDDSMDAGSDQIGKFLALRCIIVRQYRSYFVMWFSYRTKFILNRYSRKCIFIVPLIIVVAPHHFDAEPDPDSTCYPDGGSGFCFFI